MNILGIETSCDETSAAIIKDGLLLSNVVYSQKIHVKYGGVVPEYASREHEKNLIKDFKLVSIHVRRGDYLEYKDYHLLLSLTYYIDNITNLLDSYSDNLFFIICSDDIEWCKRVFYTINDKSYFSNNSGIIDMMIMSKCDINIISNSSIVLFA